MDLIIKKHFNRSVRCLEITVFAYCKDVCYMTLNSIFHFTIERTDIYIYIYVFFSETF